MVWVGPSTALYYAEICKRSEALQAVRSGGGPSSTLEMSIESLDLAKAVSLLGRDGDENSWEGFDQYHRQAIARLRACGAQVALMASNTPHHRFDTIAADSNIPLIDLYAVLAQRCRTAGLPRVLILGTRTTMASHVLRGHFERAGVSAFVPDERDRDGVIDLIERLQKGPATDAREVLKGIVERASRDSARPSAVVLACTELPLAFAGLGAQAEFDHDGMHYLNSAIVHVEAALETAYGSSGGAAASAPVHQP